MIPPSKLPLHKHLPPPPPAGRMILGLAVLMTTTGLGFWGAQTVAAWHTRQQLARDWAAISRAVDWQWQQQYPRCIQEVNRISPESAAYARAQQVLYDCQDLLSQQQLDRAEALAAAGHLKAALLELAGILPEFYPVEVQYRIELWSKRMVAIAEEYFLAGDLAAALSIARSLPEGNPLQPIAQSQMADWQTLWTSNQQQQQAVRVALGMDDVETALAHVNRMQPHPHWQPQIDAMTQQIDAKRQEIETSLQLAKQALWRNHLNEAIRLLNEVPDLPLWAEQEAQLLNEIRLAQQSRPRFDWGDLVGIVLVMGELLKLVGALIR
jgi:tetratricopeptide (TPR) repeat protein